MFEQETLSASAPEQVSAPESAPAIESVESQEQAPYTPSLKYKVYDQEKEFPDWAKSYVKDPETESRFKELFEKSDGLPFIKDRLAKEREEKKRLTASWNKLEKLRDTDLNALFEVLNVPKDKVQKHVLESLQYEELDPSSKAEVDRIRQINRDNMILQEQVAAYNEQQNRDRLAAANYQLDTALSDAAYKPLIERMPDLKTRVVQFADYVYKTQGVDLNASQAITEYAKFVGFQPQASNQQKPSIPNLSKGAAASPAMKSLRSLDDMRKLIKSKSLGV